MAERYPQEWVELPHTDRQYPIARIDVTLMLSHFDCIYGQGCKGLKKEPSAVHGCCATGPYYTDEADIERVAKHVARLTPEHTQNWKELQQGGYLRKTGNDDRHRVVRGACIFLNTHPAMPGCALHHAAVAAGESPKAWKPEVCNLVPMRVDYDDDREMMIITRYSRDESWGDQEDGWWCLEDSAAFDHPDPFWMNYQDQLLSVLGLQTFTALRRYLEKRSSLRGVPVSLKTAKSGSGS